MSQMFKNPVTLFSGGGGLVSTMDDYLDFCKMLLNDGELNGTRILSEEAVELIMSNQLPANVTYQENMGYGLAGGVNLTNGEYGWAGAASTKFWINPKQNMIIITMAQLMPSDYSYADSFKKIVDRAAVN
jgi:CubicO group peptidase (beta-lactamase class C family)